MPCSSPAGSPEAHASRNHSYAADGPERATPATSVLVMDPHEIIRRVIANVIDAEADLETVGQAASADEAFTMLAETRPHVAVVDISLEDAHGLDLVQNLQAQHPQVRVVVFSMHDERVYAERAIRAGAAGYVMKSDPTKHLMEAIRCARRKEVYLSQRARSLLLSKLMRSEEEPRLCFAIDELTGREMKVFQLTGRGMTSSDIASRLGVGRNMVNVYQRRVRRKLHLGTLAELRHFAIQWMMASQYVR